MAPSKQCAAALLAAPMTRSASSTRMHWSCSIRSSWLPDPAAKVRVRILHIAVLLGAIVSVVSSSGQCAGCSHTSCTVCTPGWGRTVPCVQSADQCRRRSGCVAVLHVRRLQRARGAARRCSGRLARRQSRRPCIKLLTRSGRCADGLWAKGLEAGGLGRSGGCPWLWIAGMSCWSQYVLTTASAVHRTETGLEKLVQHASASQLNKKGRFETVSTAVITAGHKRHGAMSSSQSSQCWL